MRIAFETKTLEQTKKLLKTSAWSYNQSDDYLMNVCSMFPERKYKPLKVCFVYVRVILTYFVFFRFLDAYVQRRQRLVKLPGWVYR